MANAVFPTQGALSIYQEIPVGMLFKRFSRVSASRDAGVAKRFPAKNTWSRLWGRRASGWTKGRMVKWLKVTTKISRMHG